MLLRYWRIVEILNHVDSKIQLMQEWYSSSIWGMFCVWNTKIKIIYKRHWNEIFITHMYHCPQQSLIFGWSSWTVQEEFEIAPEHPIIFVKSFPQLLSEMWWLELDKIQNVLLLCMLHQRTLILYYICDSHPVPWWPALAPQLCQVERLLK